MKAAFPWVAIIVAVVVVALVTNCATGSPARADTTINPNQVTLAPSSAGGSFLDATSSSGTALILWSPGSFTMPMAVTAEAAISIRARADLCDGAPVLNAKLDGAPIGSISVSSTTWSEYSLQGTITPGSHTLSLEYVNDLATASCDRNVYLDRVVARDDCPVGQFQARYYSNTTLSGSPARVACENAPGGSFDGSPAAGVNADNYSVDYVGRINFPSSGPYAVSLTLGNVGARLWLDDTLVIDAWSSGTWGSNSVIESVPAGIHTVRGAYFNTSGIAHFGLATPTTSVGVPSTNGTYFSPDSWWNKPIPSSSTVDPRSAAWINQLDSAVTGIGLNSSDWTTTVYNAPAGTPTTQITITNASNKKVTIPFRSNYLPTPDSDAHLVVIDDTTGCAYEFQGFNSASRTAIAHASYKVKTGSGGHIAGPSHSGGEFSYLAGMITPQDVASGTINHALRYAMPGNAPTYVYPGTRSDGTLLGGVPEGTRIRLDPSLNLSSFGLTPFQTMVARALQVYGGFNADSSSHFVLYARSTLDGSTYTQALSGLPDSLVRHLQFLAPATSSADVYLDRADDFTCNQAA